MNEGDTPKLSVIVISFNGPGLLDRCLRSLERRTPDEAVEVLVVGKWDAERTDSGDVRWICAPAEYNVPQMRALGMARSRGEIIALLEDDCVVAETWPSAVVKAHEGPWGAIGGAVEPGDYGKSLDWAVYFSEYGRFMRPLPHLDTTALPGTNVSYKRAALGEWLRSQEHAGFYEVLAHDRLRQAGQVLKVDPALVAHNINSWKGHEVLRARFHHGRGFAAMRVAGRRPWRRLPYLGLAAALPVIQVGRIIRQVGMRKRYLSKLAQSLPWIILLSISWSIGEFVGYLSGPGGSLEQLR